MASGSVYVANDTDIFRGSLDNGNSTRVNLSAGGVFTGEAVDTLPYHAITVLVYSDQESATGGLQVQYSSNQEDWHLGEEYTVPAESNKFFTPTIQNRYMRIVYTNGAVATTDFHIHVTLRKHAIKWSSHNIDDPITDNDDAELVKSIITGKKDDGTYDNAALTRNGHFKTSIEEYGDTPSVDAFARLRVSDNYTIFDSKQLHDKQPLFWDESIGGSATSVHSAANAETDMTVTASASDFVIRQTKQRFNYQPGKSQLIFMTFHSPSATGATKRIGLFDGTGTNNLTPNNGIWFETDGTNSWNIAKNGTTTESVSQANWNYDKLDGTGRSGITLDIEAAQIIIIDYEWLGVGRVRVGFVIDGLIHYCHYFKHANDSNFSSVYMSTPNLPLRYDIQTDGTEGTHLSHICSTVISEGGIEQTGILRSVDTGITHVDANAADTSYAVVGIRQKAAYNDITILPEFFSMINEQSGGFRWSLCLNPTIAGTFTYNDLTNSAVQYATGATANTVSDLGIVVDSGYTTGSATTRAGGDRKFVTTLRIGSTISGTRDELVLVVTPLTTNQDIQGSLTFRELI